MFFEKGEKMMKRKRSNVGKKLMMVFLCCILLCSVGVVHGQAAKKSSKATYYVTVLNGTKGPAAGKHLPAYCLPGTNKVTCKGNTLTFYGSFIKSNKAYPSFARKNFVKYGKKTFKVTSRTKYYGEGLSGKYSVSKKRAFSNCKSLYGFFVTLKVKNGKVEYMRFSA